MTNPQENNIMDGSLLPCPFCGGEAKRVTLGPDAGPDNEGGDVIVCTGVCGASSHVEFGFKENLVSLWNVRAEADQVREALERLREALSQIASKNDLSGVDEGAVEAAARSALYDCECIALAAIGPEACRADNGDEMDSPVRARIPDLIRARLNSESHHGR